MAKVHPGFTLAQLIETTANELRKVGKKPSNKAVMQFTGCELELAVKVGAEAGGGIKFFLGDLSAKGSSETASKIKLSFGPLDGEVLAAVAKTTSEKGAAAKRKKGK